MFGGDTAPAQAVSVLKSFDASVTCYNEKLVGYGQFAAKNAGL